MVENDNYQDLAALEVEKYGKYLTLIRLDPPSPTCNCHGWVFAGGKHWISGEDVCRILKENGYEEVNKPIAGDVITYRQGDAILHTGVVRGVTRDGVVLVESKWAKMGRFLHPADKTVYVGDVFYYRSHREGHTLKGIDPAMPAAVRTTMK